MTDFDQLIAQFEQQKGRKLTPKEIAGCKELWESTLKPQLQQQEKPK
ncbi:hypothetical protein [Leptolyngbya ohadii]|nr:hypothetical protein [Leptolyngbya ohadii]